MDQKSDTTIVDGDAAEAKAGRRRLLGLAAGAAAVGAVAAVSGGSSASAADGGNLLIGSQNTGSATTHLRRTAASAGNVFTAHDAPVYPFSAYPAGVGGYGYGNAGVTNGVYGFSQARSGATTTGYGLVGYTTAAGRSPLLLQSDGGDPRDHAFAHRSGELTVDGGGNLWACVEGGTPGTWLKLAGPTTGGAFHTIDPVRAYDSRKSAYPTNGPLAPNSSRLVSVADGHDGDGAVTDTDVVPEGATAITCNLTVAGPTGANYLSMTPGDAASFTASSINFVAGSALANGITSKLDDSRQVKVFCGDQGGSAHFIIDVTGFYL